MFTDFTKFQKLYLLMCGLIVAIALSWVTYVYMEYRVVNMQWEEKFGGMTPSQIWDIPTANWKPIINKFNGGING